MFIFMLGLLSATIVFAFRTVSMTQEMLAPEPIRVR